MRYALEGVRALCIGLSVSSLFLHVASSDVRLLVAPLWALVALAAHALIRIEG